MSHHKENKVLDKILFLFFYYVHNIIKNVFSLIGRSTPSLIMKSISQKLQLMMYQNNTQFETVFGLIYTFKFISIVHTSKYKYMKMSNYIHSAKTRIVKWAYIKTSIQHILQKITCKVRNNNIFIRIITKICEGVR